MIAVSRLHADLIIFSFVFSILFCCLSFVVDSLISFWVFLELCGLSIVPCFFYNSGSSIYGFYNSLLTYIIMSTVSSVLLVSGILMEGLYYFIFLGFLVKFGLFPFSLWVYRVFSESNWAFIFFLSVVMKFPVIVFCYLFNDFSLYIIYGDSLLTIAMCGIFFWLYSSSWEFIWCHTSLASISTLLVACFCSSSELCYFIYFYYFIWSLMCILYFYSLSDDMLVDNNFWFYCFLLLVTPFSLPLFYKLSVCLAIFYSSIYILFIWSLYSFSEQFFLYKLASNYFYSNSRNNWL